MDSELDRNTLAQKKPLIIISEGNNSDLLYMDELNLIDPWCLKYPTKRKHTFYSSVHQNLFRLDYFFLMSSTKECNIDICYVSGHREITLKCVFQKPLNISRHHISMFLCRMVKNLHNKCRQRLYDIFYLTSETSSVQFFEWKAYKSHIQGRRWNYCSCIT